MTNDNAIRRRPDGSIDIEFYTRRATLMRCNAQRSEPARGVMRIVRGIAKLIAAAHMPRTGRASPRRR